MMEARLCVAVLALFLGYTHGYSSGAPGAGTCIDMTPDHAGTSPSTDPWPFTLTPSSDSYQPGETLTVTLSGIDDTKVKGFYIQARPASVEVDEDSNLVGHFEDEDGLSQIRCGNGNFGDGNGLTHVSSADKDDVVFTWTAPEEGVGPVRFWITTVVRRVEYWIRQRSDVVDGPEPPSPNGTTTTTPTPTMEPVPELDMTTCGISKGCFREPPECDLDSCNIVVTWLTNSSDVTDFEIRGSLDSDEKWVSMGLSDTPKMEFTSVTDCILNEIQNQVVVQTSYNSEGTENQELTDSELGIVPGSVSGSFVDGVILCRFSRFIVMDNRLREQDLVYPLNRDYHIITARGPGFGGEKAYHEDHRQASPEKVNVTSRDYVDIGGSFDFPLVKAHGSLMTFAWVSFVGLGVLMPRHFKPVWPEQKLGGLAIWFQIHRACMSLAFLLTISGFIIIFVHVGGYSNIPSLPAKAHPVLGIIVTALAVLNPAMALFRPHPGTPSRPVFNWAHFLVGQAAHVLGVVTVYLGLDMRVSDESAWVLVAFVIWHAVTEGVLGFHTWSLRRSYNEAVKDNQVHEMKHPGMVETLKKPPSGTAFKTAVMAVYVCGNVAFAVTLVVMIGTL